MTDDAPSEEWTTNQVLEALRQQSWSGEPASAQVFLRDSVAGEDLARKAGEIVRAACGDEGERVSLGKIHRLARSFSVQGDAEAIGRIARGDVKAILPSRIDDIHPKPMNSKSA